MIEQKIFLSGVLFGVAFIVLVATSSLEMVFTPVTWRPYWWTKYSEMFALNLHKNSIHAQYSDIMRFTELHNRHHKVSLSLQFVNIRVRGHFVMSITKYHDSHYVGVLDNPQE